MEDKKAIEILLKRSKASKEEIEYAKKAGYIFDDWEIEHDEANIIVRQLSSEVSKKKIVDNFLYSLSTRELIYRSGMRAYSNGKNMSLHGFPIDESQQICEICHFPVYRKKQNITDLLRAMYSIGGTIGTDVVDLAFSLSVAEQIDHKKPSSEDFKILKRILQLVEKLPPETTAPKFSQFLAKEKILKSNSEERRLLIESLGFMSIFETYENKGFMNYYVPKWYHEMTYHPRGEYSYPVNLWRTKDGLNIKALKFWFGNYLTKIT